MVTILECDYVYNAWRAERTAQGWHLVSQEKGHQNRPFTEEYALCGVYRQSGEPYTLEKITRDAYPDLPAHQAVPRSFSDRVAHAVAQGNRVLTPSGYCIYAPAVLGGIQRALGEDKVLGVVWIDAHTDNFILEDTAKDSVTLVGVPLSTLLGQTMERWRVEDCGLQVPCRGENVLVSDARRAGEEGIRNLKASGARWLNEEEFEDTSRWRREVQALARRVDALYVMLDADILHASYIPAYFRQEPGGHTWEKVAENLGAVMETGKVAAFSAFCFDFDKAHSGEETTVLNAMRILGAGLSAWK